MKQPGENHWIVGDGMEIYQKYQERRKYVPNSVSFQTERDSKVLVILHRGKQSRGTLEHSQSCSVAPRQI
jgi:hypothetical protein